MEIIATSKNLELINKPLNIVTVKKTLADALICVHTPWLEQLSVSSTPFSSPTMTNNYCHIT